MNQNKQGLNRFRNALVKHARSEFINSKEERDRILNRVSEILFSEKSIVDEKLESVEKKVIQKIVRGFLEIDKSYQILNDIPLYIRNFPAKLNSKERYLYYNISNYLNEVYILHNRLGAYTKIITRIYRNDPMVPKIQKQLKILKDLLSFIFSDIVHIRGAHVHEERFTDRDLYTVGFAESLSNEKYSGLKRSDVNYLLRLSIRAARGKWLDMMKKNNKNIKRVLDVYFGVLHQLVFNVNNQIKLPKNQ